jgi:hypothetical protein
MVWGMEANINHIEAAIRYVRACGPVSESEIANEIRIQVQGANRENCQRLAKSAVNHGASHGWISSYDEESYVIANR